MADQPEPVQVQPETPALPTVDAGAEMVAVPVEIEAPAPSEPPVEPDVPVAAEPATQPVAHVEVPSDPAPDDGTPVIQWVGAGVITVVLAGVAMMALQKRMSQPVLPSPMVPTSAIEPPAPTADAATESVPDSGLVSILRTALARTGAALRGQFDGLFGRPIDEQLFEDLEEVLLVADVGMPTTDRILEKVRQAAKDPDPQPEQLRAAMREEMRLILDGVHQPMIPPTSTPWVILVVGVNGSGKTTTIGKLADRYQKAGKSVLVAAGDTYRAAAAEQLAVWADRAGADMVQGKDGSDPGAVIYDALTAAKARGHDIVLVDTAGRLQTAKPLMDQLAKIHRVINKVVPGAPHETLLVVDGTIGQNAMSQAKLFHQATPLTGVVVTKLDGTAKGGMILALAAEMALPVKLVGVGEQITDLRDFDPGIFVDAVS